MPLVLSNRVQETATANTTVSFTLTGAVTGFQTFATIGNTNTTYYSATDNGGNWEVGLGTYSTTGPTLTRTTVYASSNTGSAVTFSGVVNVFVTYPADRSVNLDASGNASALGTPVSATLTNATGLPVATGISGLGSGVATFLATPSSANLAAAVTDETGTGSAVFATSPTLVTPALGTPSALVGTNITGTAAGLTAGNVTTNANLTGAITSTGNATLLGSFSSANLAGALTDETGTGSAVFANSPTLVTPALGTPASGVVTNLTGTASININGTVGATTATTGAFTTLAASGDVTLSGGTANGVAYLNGSKVVTSGSALTYNGTDITFSGNLFGAVGSGYWVSGAGSYNAGIYGDASAGTSLRFQANGSEQMRLTSTGLGIGTSSPQFPLDVQTTQSRFQVRDGANTGGTSAGTGLVSINATATALDSFNYRATTHAFIIDSSEAMRLTSTGLGIGTSSPSAKFHVAASGSDPILFANSGGGSYNSAIWENNNSLKLAVGIGGGSVGGNLQDTAYVGPISNIALVLQTNNTERMRLDASGNLGIGTTNPAYRLTVSAPDNNGVLILSGNDSHTGFLYFGDTASNTVGALSYDHSNNAMRFQTAGSEQMRLTSTGLGIGTSSPSASIKLHLNYDSVNQRAIRLQDTNGSFDFITSGGSDNHSFGIYDDTNGAYRLFITSGGNLGIGTSSPATKLDVLSPVSATPVTNGVARIVTTGANPATGSGGGLLFAQQASSTAYTNYASITGVRVNNAGDDKVDLAISTGSPGDGIAIAERIRVKTTGEVGVGTTTPQFKLDVINNATYQLRLATGTGQNYVSGGLYLGAIDTSDPFYYGYMRWDQTDISLKIGSQHGNNTGGIVFLTGNGNGAQTERARFTNVGNFGVGTSAPSAIIQSYSTNLGDGGGLKIQNGGAGGATYAIWPTATVNGEGAGKLIISGPSGNAVTIDSAGNFGLGITTPVSYNTGARIIQSHNAGGGSSEVKLTNATTGTTRTAGFLLLQSGLDTYVWNGSNSFMAFGTNDSERARIDNIGNLLVGTTGSDTAAASVIIERSGTTASTGAYFVIKNQNGSQSTNGVLTPAGGILFSTYRDVRNPSYTAGITYEARGVSGTNTGAELIFRTAAGTGNNFANEGNSALPAERARIDSSGNLLIGTTSQASNERVSIVTGATEGYRVKTTGGASAAAGVIHNATTTGDNVFLDFGTEASYTSRGSITYNRAGGLVAYNVTSDYRAKDIIGPVTDSGALIDSVPVYMGKMHGATQERPMFIAHEVPAYAHTGEKDAVDADGNPVYQQMDASALIPVMWAEIQSLRARLAAANI